MTESSIKRPWWKIAALGVWSYLKDWRNLLSHAALGFVLLALAIWLPVAWWVRLLVILALVSLNTLRMRRRQARLAASAAEETAPPEKETASPCSQ